MSTLSNKNFLCLVFLIISFFLEVLSSISYIILFLIELKNKKDINMIDLGQEYEELKKEEPVTKKDEIHVKKGDILAKKEDVGMKKQELIIKKEDIEYKKIK